MGKSQTLDLSGPEVKCIDLKSGVDGADVLFVYSGCDSAVYRNLSTWLKKEETRYLVFIEEQEEVFLKAKELPFAKDPKVRIYYYKKEAEEIFQHIAWEFVFLRFAYSIPSSTTKEAAEEFFVYLEHYHRGVDLLASDCEDMGLKVLSNAMKNLSAFPRSLLGGSLEGKCTGMPAIICGAGPSLNDVIPLLATLKDKAILIAGGSAVPALNAQGIIPHFAAGIDPQPPLNRFLNQDSFESPFFYQGRFCSDLLQRVHGPLLWMPDGGTYPLETWAYSECGLFAEKFDAGWTVSNFCTSLAAHLGCSTVIFVGMDFSRGPDTIYASQMPGDEHKDPWIELEKGKLYSKKDWLMSAEWMGAFAKKNPGIQWLNATMGGIDLPGIEKTSLEEIAANFLQQRWDVEGWVHSCLSKANATDVTLEKVADVRNRVKMSFEKSLEICDALLKVWEKHFPNSPLEQGEYAVLEIDLQQEICHSHFLMPLWNVWKRPILRSSFHALGQHIHQLLFFQKAIESHLPYLRSFP